MCISEFRQGNSSSFYIRSNISKPVHLHFFFFYTYSWRRTTHPKGKHIWQNSTGLLTQMQRDDLHVKLSLPQNNLLNSSVIENKTCCVWNAYLSSPQLCLLSQRKCSVIPRSCFPSSHSQKLVIHPPLWVRVQLCFSDLFHCLRFFLLSSDLSGSGDQCAALCLSNLSVSLTPPSSPAPHTFFSPIYLFLLPPSQFKRWRITPTSGVC